MTNIEILTYRDCLLALQTRYPTEAMRISVIAGDLLALSRGQTSANVREHAYRNLQKLEAAVATADRREE